MGGTGSVLQHDEKATYSKAEETGLLRLYNRKHREKKGLSGKLGAVGIKIEQFEKGGSWATASAVSAALREVGVTAGDQAIRALANQDYHLEERRLQSAKTTRPNNATPAAAEEEEDLRLVHWPSILAFLEDPYSHTPHENSAVSNLILRLRGTSPRRENENTDKIRDVPDTGTVTTEMCGRHQDGREDTPHGERGEEIDQQQHLGCAREAFVENGADAVRGDPVDVGGLVNAACMAAKKGDASAIKVGRDSCARQGH